MSAAERLAARNQKRGKSSPAKAQEADAERNPITTPSQTARTASRIAGMGDLVEQTASMRNTLLTTSSATTYADRVKSGNASSIGAAMNLSFTPRADEQDQTGGQEAKSDFNATMRKLASEQTRTLEVKKNTELSIRMNQTMKEKHDADLTPYGGERQRFARCYERKAYVFW